jgi:hypothetical protein
MHEDVDHRNGATHTHTHTHTHSLSLSLTHTHTHTHTHVLFPRVQHPPPTKPAIPANCNQKSPVIYSCRYVWRTLIYGQLWMWWAAMMFCALMVTSVIFSVRYETLNHSNHLIYGTHLYGYVEFHLRKYRYSVRIHVCCCPVYLHTELRRKYPKPFGWFPPT